MARLTDQLEQIRAWRKPNYKETSIASTILAFRKSLKKTNKQLTQILEAWDEHVPEQIHRNAIPTSLKSGVLEVTVTDSPTSYQLNQLIRSGLLNMLQKQSSGTLKKIKVRLAN
ncbi:MAG: DciA family protein [Phycisphaerales bacterium]|jgi:predicted nucleic acid-binding Zn ribbon protein